MYLCEGNVEEGLAYNIIKMFAIFEVALSLAAKLQVIPLKCVEQSCWCWATFLYWDFHFICANFTVVVAMTASMHDWVVVIYY